MSNPKNTRTDVRNTRTGRYTTKDKAEKDKKGTVTETRSLEKMVPAVEAQAAMDEARRRIEQLETALRTIQTETSSAASTHPSFAQFYLNVEKLCSQALEPSPDNAAE